MRALIAASFVLLVIAPAFAQPASSTLVIDVSDATGTAMAGVAITVVNRATAVERQASTSDRGNAAVPLRWRSSHISTDGLVELAHELEAKGYDWLLEEAVA